MGVSVYLAMFIHENQLRGSALMLFSGINGCIKSYAHSQCCIVQAQRRTKSMPYSGKAIERERSSC